jgi:sugar/nucleoside kinase (ribokinase family)
LRDTVELHLNVLAGFQPKLPESYRDAEYVFLGNIDPAMQMEVLNQIRRLKLVACDTMDHWIRESPQDLKKVLERIEILVVNDSEARLLSGNENIVKAARAILKMGPKMILIKRGEYGVLQFSDSSMFATPAYPLEEVFDPTGAGDSFAGGFLGQLARSGDQSQGGLRRAIVYGSVVASFTVEDFGVKRLTDLSMAEVEERYRRFIELTDFRS